MKDLEYKPKGYRLNDKTIENLAELKKELGLSYNLLFAKLINNYKKYEVSNK